MAPAIKTKQKKHGSNYQKKKNMAPAIKTKQKYGLIYQNQTKKHGSNYQNKQKHGSSYQKQNKNMAPGVRSSYVAHYIRDQ